MTIKRFFLFSIFVHILILGAVYFMPEQQAKKTKEFITQLVTPDELKRPEVVPLPVRPVPTGPKIPEKIRPVPRTRQAPPPVSRILPRTLPTPDKPVVPGMEKEAGKPLPEGVVPGPGKEEGGEARQKEPAQDAGKPGLSRREKLFDIGEFGEAPKKGLGGEGGKKKEDAITFDTREYRYAGYMRKLKEKIESIWEYPAEARSRRLYGDLKIRFTIKKDGRLGTIELVRTSGYKTLDDAAIRALKDGEPYWPLPDEWGLDSYTILGHFIYTMYGYGIQ